MPVEFFIKGKDNGLFSLVDTFEKIEDIDYEIIVSTYHNNIPGFDIEGFADYLTLGRKDITELEKEEKIYLPQDYQSPSSEVNIIQKLLDTPHGLVYMGIFNHHILDNNKNFLQITTAGNFVPAVRFAHILMHNITLLINEYDGYNAIIEDDTPKYLPKDNIINLLEDSIIPIFAKYAEKNNVSYPLKHSE